MTIPHAVVWLDHHEAKIFFLHEDDSKFEEQTLKSEGHHAHNHHKHDDHHRHDIDKKFFASLAKTLGDVNEILLVGPGSAKTELSKWLKEHASQVSDKVLGIESLDHPTEGQIAHFARKFFKKADKMLGGPRVG